MFGKLKSSLMQEFRSYPSLIVNLRCSSRHRGDPTKQHKQAKTDQYPCKPLHEVHTTQTDEQVDEKVTVLPQKSLSLNTTNLPQTKNPSAPNDASSSECLVRFKVVLHKQDLSLPKTRKQDICTKASNFFAWKKDKPTPGYFNNTHGCIPPSAFQFFGFPIF